jgi:group I intron endonuclease
MIYCINDVFTKGCIYRLTSPSGKCYIGQSWNIRNRLNYYKNGKCNPTQRKIYAAVRKYGPENFKYEIIDVCETQPEMDAKEIYYIEFYNTIKNGYNIYPGGRGFKHTITARQNISKYHTGRKLSESQRLKVKNQFGGVLTNDIIDEKLVNKNIKRIDDYINSKTKIKFKCLKHDFEFLSYPTNILRNRGCKFCKQDKNRVIKNENFSILFTQKIKDIPIILLTSYQKAKIHVKVQCKMCDNIWNITPCNLTRGRKCPKCSFKFPSKTLSTN